MSAFRGSLKVRAIPAVMAPVLNRRSALGRVRNIGAWGVVIPRAGGFYDSTGDRGVGVTTCVAKSKAIIYIGRSVIGLVVPVLRSFARLLERCAVRNGARVNDAYLG